MAVLTARDRKRLPAKAFAGPDRSYPVNDPSHAANAKARATQAVKAGRMGKGEEARIDSKANRVLAGASRPEGHERPKDSPRARHGMEVVIMLHPKTLSAAERRKRGDENALPRPHEEHFSSRGYNEPAKAKAKMKREPEMGREKPERKAEPKKESPKVAREHERKGEKKHMDHEKTIKAHERAGEKKAVREERHLYVHHVHHHMGGEKK